MFSCTLKIWRRENTRKKRPMIIIEQFGHTYHRSSNTVQPCRHLTNTLSQQQHIKAHGYMAILHYQVSAWPIPTSIHYPPSLNYKPNLPLPQQFYHHHLRPPHLPTQDQNHPPSLILISDQLFPLHDVIYVIMLESPIRSMQASSSHRNTQVYEEQFWKLKAQRAEAAAEKLKQENQQLTKQLLQPPRLALDEETLLQSTTSHDKNDLERLTKELRMAKNSKEVETAQLNEEIRTLKKQLRDAEASLTDLRSRQTESKGLGKLEEENARLSRRLQSSEEERARLREEKARIVAECEEFKREAQELRLKQRLAQKEEQQKFHNYRKYCEEQADLTLSQRQPMSRISQRQELNEDQPEPSAKPEERQQLQQQLTAASQQIEQLHYELQSVKNLQLSSGIREKKLQAEAEEARKELERVLEKLAPLLVNRQELAISRENVEARASLSLLEVFLKKYKIQSF